MGFNGLMTSVHYTHVICTHTRILAEHILAGEDIPDVVNHCVDFEQVDWESFPDVSVRDYPAIVDSQELLSPTVPSGLLFGDDENRCTLHRWLTARFTLHENILDFIRCNEKDQNILLMAMLRTDELLFRLSQEQVSEYQEHFYCSSFSDVLKKLEIPLNPSDIFSQLAHSPNSSYILPKRY